MEPAVQYPDAPRVSDHDVIHGTWVADPYRWLEDPDDHRTQAWQAQQAQVYLRCRNEWPHGPEWSEQVCEAMAYERSSIPVMRGSRVFSMRATKAAEMPALYVSETGQERLLVDPLSVDPAGETVLEDWHACMEGNLVAYQLSRQGTEDCSLFVQEVSSGRLVDGPIDRVRRTPVAWLPGGESFYYVRRLPTGTRGGDGRYHRRVYLHRLGADPDDDVLIFGDGRPATQFYTVAVTADGRWLTISATLGRSPNNELWLADLWSSDPARPTLRPVQQTDAGRTHTRFAPETSPNDPMWLRTTVGAARGRVVKTTPRDPVPDRWSTLISQRGDAVLKDFLPLTGLAEPVAVVTWLRHAICEITMHDLRDGRELGTVPLPGLGSVGPLHTHPWPSHVVWFAYSDHTTPPTVLRFDARARKLQTVSPDSAEAAHYHVTLETATSPDGTLVRLFVVSPTGAPDRARPTILTGYGGFGAAMTPQYGPEIAAWVRAGGVFVVSCLRGGGEEGGDWHRAGTGRHKQRVFDDFDAVTDHLVTRGWSTHRRLGILGSSNGGLLVAAALTQHPEKYGAVVSLAPLTDMVRYEKSGMGPSWRTEYGSVEDEADFLALRAYSPYHNVRKGAAFPAVLLGAFEADSRVDPSHARKLTAALQHASAEVALLRVEDKVGHGARSSSRMAGLYSDVLTFFGRYLGLCPREGRCECCCAR